ncbi:MAG: rRNA ((1498)-N(3))-methyltransferase [Bacteroidota bacterium]|jgi:16S rRNA (uracil1498-N3)-methyltransferase
MGIPVFYLENPEIEPTLSADDSFHANKVLRLKTGDSIYLLNGKGKKYKAILTESNSKKSLFSNLSIETDVFENKNLLNLWIAPTKQMERIEWMVEKCTEMGLRSIGFFYSKNSERKEIKLPRLEKIIISAIKQSKQLFLPEIHEIQSFEGLVNSLKIRNEQNGFAYISTNNSKSIQNFAHKKKISNILIGPEGDFTQKEIELLFSNDFNSFSLGESILRTETAGLLCTAAFAINS